ncbi:MAG: hypothetical protein HGB08_04090 [Candidatus Moranbacteria bacterium]|nr:hypothetical protein [Candidatus Moranbacteria bacterium]
METRSEEAMKVEIKTGGIDANTGSFSSMSNESRMSRLMNMQLKREGMKDDSGKKRNSGFVLGLFDKIIGLSVFMIAIGIPLYFTSLSFQGIVFEKQLYFYFWLLLALVSWAAKGVITEEMNIKRTPLDIPIVGFWAACLLSVFFSVDRWHSFWGAFGDPSRGFMSITAVIILYYLIISNFDQRRLRSILFGLVGGGAILVFWSSLIFLKIPFIGGTVDSLVSGHFAQFIPLSASGSITGLGAYFSALLVLFTVSVLKLAEKDKMGIMDRVSVGVLLAALFFDLILLLSIYGFVPWIGLFSGIVVFLIYILSKIVRPKMSWAWLPMVLFVAVMIIRMTGEVQISRVNFPTEASLNYKLSSDIAVSSLKDRFILGSGPATYGYDFSLHKPQYFNENALYMLRFYQGTGIAFESIATLGALGTFFLVILILSFVSVSIYLISREKEKNKLYSLGLLAASLVLLIDAISMKMEGTVLILTALVGIIALASILNESDTQTKTLSLSLKASPKFALALAFVFMVISAGVAFLFVFLGKIYTADIYAGRAVMVSSANTEDAVMKMNRAISLNPREGAYYSKLGELYMILANKEVMKDDNSRNVDLIRQLVNSSLYAASAGSNLQKNDVGSIESLAQVYENSGMYLGDSLKMAEQSYEQALQLDPHNPATLLKIGQIKIAEASLEKDQSTRKGLLDDAKGFFERSVSEKSNFAEGYYQIALIDDALGDKDGTIDNATKAVQNDSGNATYLIGLANFYRFRGGDGDYDNAEKIFQYIIQSDDKNINAHFYLGLTYEKDKKRDQAKAEYQKVESLLPDGSNDTKKQLEKMIDNIGRGIENTPDSLGLTKNSDSGQGASDQPGQ